MLRNIIQKDLQNAMKAKDCDKVGALRMIVAGIKEKDVVARGKGEKEASEQDILSHIQTMIKQRNDSAKIYEDAGRQELADKERKEVSIIEAYLPKQLSEEEIVEAIKAAAAEAGAETIRDMGKVMAYLKDKYSGQMDFAKASSLVKGFFS